MSFITYQGGDSEDWESINAWIFAYQVIQSIHVPHKTELFAALFTDSTIAKQFSMRKTKCAYYLINNKFTWRMEWLCTLGIFFLQSLKEFPLYAVSFDESYTNVLKQAQMDLFIRYWKSEKKSACLLLKQIVHEKVRSSWCAWAYNSCFQCIEKTKFYKFSLMDEMSSCHF